jgi:hypothetical protein
MAVGDRPEIRTTADYLKGREALREEAEVHKKEHGLEDQAEDDLSLEDPDQI